MWWEPEVASNIKESRCIKAVETLPSKEAHGSTYHANSHFLTKNEEGDWETYGRLSEYAYGKLGEVAPMGACRTEPADSKVGWSIHYYPDGTAVPNDQVTVGIWYHDDDFDEACGYRQDLSLYMLQGADYDIPPHGKLMTQGFHSFDHPVRIDSWQLQCSLDWRLQLARRPLVRQRRTIFNTVLAAITLMAAACLQRCLIWAVIWAIYLIVLKGETLCCACRV